mgnify:CR=1 FL=1
MSQNHTNYKKIKLSTLPNVFSNLSANLLSTSNSPPESDCSITVILLLSVTIASGQIPQIRFAFISSVDPFLLYSSSTIFKYSRWQKRLWGILQRKKYTFMRYPGSVVTLNKKNVLFFLIRKTPFFRMFCTKFDTTKWFSNDELYIIKMRRNLRAFEFWIVQ